MTAILGSGFSWLGLIPALTESEHDFVPLAHACLAALVVLFMAVLARLALMGAIRKAKDPRAALVPEDNLRPRNLFELLIEFVYGLCRQELGDKARTFFPLIGTLFIYILTMNLMGLVPGFVPATSYIECNVGMALTVFLVYNIAGLRAHGFGYIKHLMGPVLLLAPLMFVIEVVGHCVRPVSLSMRLYGNMFGDHTVLSIFMVDLPAETSPILAYGIPVIFLGLGTFVCVVQAFVFSLLSIIYISMATAHEEEH